MDYKMKSLTAVLACREFAFGGRPGRFSLCAQDTPGSPEGTQVGTDQTPSSTANVIGVPDFKG